MKKVTVFVLSVLLLLSFGVMQSSDAVPLLEVSGFVNPADAVVTDNLDGTSTFSQLDYLFRVDTATEGATLNRLKVEFESDVFFNMGTVLVDYPSDWTYQVYNTSYELGTAGTALVEGEVLRFSMLNTTVYTAAITDSSLWDEGQVWGQSWDAIDITFLPDPIVSDGGSTAVVPEPGTFVLFGLGIAGLLYVRRTKTFNIYY